MERCAYCGKLEEILPEVDPDGYLICEECYEKFNIDEEFVY